MSKNKASFERIANLVTKAVRSGDDNLRIYVVTDSVKYSHAVYATLGWYVQPLLEDFHPIDAARLTSKIVRRPPENGAADHEVIGLIIDPNAELAQEIKEAFENAKAGSAWSELCLCEEIAIDTSEMNDALEFLEKTIKAIVEFRMMPASNTMH